MVHLATVVTILRSTGSDALTFVITAVITVSFDLIAAVLIGVVLAAIFALRRISRSSGVTFQPVRTEQPEEGDEEILAVRFDGQLFFVSAEQVFDTVMSVGPVTVVILRLSAVEAMDASGARVLSELVRGLEQRGITVFIKGVQPRHSELLRKVGVLRALRHQNHLFETFDAALAHARSHVRRAREGREEREERESAAKSAGGVEEFEI